MVTFQVENSTFILTSFLSPENSLEMSTLLGAHIPASNNSNNLSIGEGKDLELPPQFTTISSTSLRTILFYLILLFLGVMGNLSVLISFYRHRLALKWRITILIIHLSLADLLVITVVIPSEIVWRTTIQWYGGDLVCKVVQFGRAFGLYASSMILIVISLDRLYAIVYPLRMVRGGRRVKAMLAAAWICAAIAAAPQSLVFSVQRHPIYSTFQQCVTYNFLTTEKDEIIYNLFSVFGMYFIPLAVIVFSYSMILWKIVRKSREHRQQVASVRRQLQRGPDAVAAERSQDFGSTKVILLRRNTTTDRSTLRSSLSGNTNINANHTAIGGGGSSPGTTCTTCGNSMNTNDAAVQMMARAKWKILRLTFIIVCVFVVSWTPYVVMVLWYMFDRKSAQQVNTGLQDGLFMMAVANSCVNPFVYGNYTRGSSGNDRNSNGNPKMCLVQDRSMLTCCGWKKSRGVGTTIVTDRKKESISSHRGKTIEEQHPHPYPHQHRAGGTRCTCEREPNTTNNTNYTTSNVASQSQKCHSNSNVQSQSMVVMGSFPVTSVI